MGRGIPQDKVTAWGRSVLTQPTNTEATNTEGYARFVISIDCELYWGVHDRYELRRRRTVLEGGRAIIPRLLDLFAEYDVRATWAIVGMLFARSRAELYASSPRQRPSYVDGTLSPYRLFQTLGSDEASDPWHYGSSLVAAIGATRGQEVASHTFAHYYALAPGQTASEFAADLAAAQSAADSAGYRLSSLVFPRNQVNMAYLPALVANGFTAYRGTPSAWPYRPAANAGRSPSRRVARLLDSHVRLFARDTVREHALDTFAVVDVPATHYVRAWGPSHATGGQLRLRRIQRDMYAATDQGGLIHLWWHPDDFALEPNSCLRSLRSILDIYATLAASGRMVSQSMRDVATAALLRTSRD